jgi:hypothetical protein
MSMNGRLVEYWDKVQRGSALGIDIFCPPISCFRMALHSFQQWDTMTKGEVNANASGVRILEYIIDNQKYGWTFSGSMSVALKF